MRSASFSVARRLDVVVLTNFLALGILVSAVPRFLHQVLQADRFYTGLATTIYFVAALLVRPFIGAAVDRVGRRPFLLYPPGFVAALTLGYLATDSIAGVAALRFAAGGLAALFFTSVALAATDIAAADRRTQALGRQSVMTYTGFTLGPLVADVLIDRSWKLVWIVPALLHLATSFVAISIPETRVSTAAVSSGRPGFDRRVMRPAIAVMTANFSFSTIVAFLPEFSERLGVSRPGLLFGVYAVSVLLVRAGTGAIADKMGPARFTVPALALGCVGLALLAIAQEPWHAFVAIAIVGGSLGSTFPAATAASLQRVGTEDRGKAMGTTLAFGDVGQASAGPLVGFLSTQFGFRWVYGIPSFLAFCAVVSMATMPEVRSYRSSRS